MHAKVFLVIFIPLFVASFAYRSYRDLKNSENQLIPDEHYKIIEDRVAKKSKETLVILMIFNTFTFSTIFFFIFSNPGLATSIINLIKEHTLAIISSIMFLFFVAKSITRSGDGNSSEELMYKTLPNMASDSDIANVIKNAALIESIIEERYAVEIQEACTGTDKKAGALGLGEKVKLLENLLSTAIKNDLKMIIHVRNNIAHEARLGGINLSDFNECCSRVTKTLGYH